MYLYPSGRDFALLKSLLMSLLVPSIQHEVSNYNLGFCYDTANECDLHLGQYLHDRIIDICLN